MEDFTRIRWIVYLPSGLDTTYSSHQRGSKLYSSDTAAFHLKELGILAEVPILVKPQSCKHMFAKPVCDPWLTFKVHIDPRPLRSVPILHNHVPNIALDTASSCECLRDPLLRALTARKRRRTPCLLPFSGYAP